MKVQFIVLKVKKHGRNFVENEVSRRDTEEEALRDIESEISHIPADLMEPAPEFYIRKVYTK